MNVVVVVDEVHLFAETAQSDEHLDALIPRYGVVGIVMHHEERRRDAIRPEEGRVLEIARLALPDRAADAALGVLVLEGARESGSPTNAAVRARHVGHGRTGHRGTEEMRLRDQERRLISTPGVALNSESFRIDVATGK